jgi:hypothetical protein
MAYRDKLVADKASHLVRSSEMKTQMGIDMDEDILQSSQYIMQVIGVEINQI